MALAEIAVIDKIEIIESGGVQIRIDSRVEKDGEVIANNYSRQVIAASLMVTAVADFRAAIDAILNP